jgi:phosphohistidine phosphatase
MEGTARLIVMRHGKAGELPGGPDFERALTPRGRGDAAAAGAWLRERGYRPDAVLCSAARRARQTWQYVSEALGGEPAVAVATDERLYHADAGQLLEIIRETGDDVRTLMYVGHNPAAAELVAGLTGSEPHFPTAAIAVVAAAVVTTTGVTTTGVTTTGATPTGGWADLAAGENELAATWTPSGGEQAG